MSIISSAPPATRLALSILALAAVGLATGCPPKSTTPGKQDPPAERIAADGHGMLFDKAGQRIKLDAQGVVEMQEAMLAVLQASQVKVSDQGAAVIAKAQDLLKAGQLSIDETILIKSAIIKRWLQDAPPEMQTKYQWRNQALLSHYLNIRPELIAKISARIRELLAAMDFFDPVTAKTSYMNDCAAHGVPIPPNWAETGTAWVEQGRLTENLLGGSEYAAVWTYTDPALRGGCIALPRGSGEPGSPAGIICQSATTGHACFWDNKLRGVPEQFIGWRGRTLVITDLKDGSNLNSPCTGCHRGNNVFNISPDDPTWALVLRGTLSRPPSNFTTVVEASSDNRGRRPRYVPITTLPVRAGWENVYSSGTGCAACHEAPSGGFTAPARMPPRCATSATSAAACYN